ncbi:hypothetical protein DNC80_12190 [Flavobacterium sp. SOK18b]|uniref:hypothetical protein n=1 Tax=Flavobacterium sp. SOK18b TaxID=797900 RepID=UPI0015FA8C43|nr:hypothetical protein [Flavobacterium sp. SOK18b]MBB1194421.1 hypothetical protein [Flavobacterium sp. SOK18b]
MEDQNTKIANLKVFISENCSETEKEIIKYYWEFKENEILHYPKQVANTFGIGLTDLKKIIASYSELSFDFLCDHCTKYEKQTINSITRYIEITKVKRQRNSHSGFKCVICKQLEEKKVIQEKKEAQKKLKQKFEQAIENKNWNNLNNFEREVLSTSLGINFIELGKKYWDQLGKESYIKLIRALEKIANENLILLFRNGPNNYIYAYEHLSYLREFKDEIKAPKKIKSSYVQTDVDTNELKFKLTINENQYHPDSPLHAGTVTFKERIVIEPGVEYIFGLWNRANENLYLTMTPLENLEKTPQTKRINSQPKSIRQVMIDYLNSLGADS